MLSITISLYLEKDKQLFKKKGQERTTTTKIVFPEGISSKGQANRQQQQQDHRQKTMSEMKANSNKHFVAELEVRIFP